MTKALAIIRAAYPRNTGVKSEADAELIVNVWFFHFGALPFEILMQAINHHVMRSPFEPKICDIYKILTALTFNIRGIIKDFSASDNLNECVINLITGEEIGTKETQITKHDISIEQYKDLYKTLASICNNANDKFIFEDL